MANRPHPSLYGMLPSSLLLLTTILAKVSVSQDDSHYLIHIALIGIGQSVRKASRIHTKRFCKHSSKSLECAQQTKFVKFSRQLWLHDIFVFGLKEHHPVDKLS